MLKTKKDERAEFAFELVMKLAGGQDQYGSSTLGAIYWECYNNDDIKSLAGMYLVGSSERAEKNLKTLKQKLYDVFLDRTGK